MTEAEARELLRRKLERCTREDGACYWIGDVTSQDETGFSFQACIYRDGEDPTKKWHTWCVDANFKTVDFLIM